MVEQIMHILSTNADLPLSARQLISRDQTSLQSMSTSSISAYLYGAKLVAEAARKYGRNIAHLPLNRFLESRQS
jgi:hypothetical protein